MVPRQGVWLIVAFMVIRVPGSDGRNGRVLQNSVDGNKHLIKNRRIRSTKISIVEGPKHPSDGQQFSLRRLKPLALLQQAFSTALDVRRLLQVFLCLVETTRPGDPKTLRQSGIEAAVPIQPPQELLIDHHRNHIGEPLECN